MKFSEHKEFIKRQRAVIIVLTILVTVAAFVFTYLSPTTHKSSISFAVNRINKQDTAEYQYDGYYAIQASDLFSQTVVSWFYTPSVLLEIYDRAGIDPAITSLETFSSRFKTRKYSAQNIVVTFSERDKNTAEKISQSIIDTVKERGASLNQTADRKALFEVVGSKPVIVEQKPPLVINTLVGLVLGFCLSLGTVYLVRYFKTG